MSASVPPPNAPIELTVSPAVSPVSPSQTEAMVTSVTDTTHPTANPSDSSAAQTSNADDTPTSWLWLTKRDQLFIGVFATVFLALSGYHWATLGGWGMRPIELERLPARQYDFRIDINSASWVEWTQIESIGEVTAQKILADREANGPFRNVKDLLRVKGIGPKKLEMMRPFLREPTTDGDVPKSAP